jgi:uncharacterized protein YjbJ (UPF0337 family)
MSAEEQVSESAVEAAQAQATQAAGPPRDAEALVRDIERTRQELGETVQALAAKADVKARAHDKAAEVKDQVTAKAGQVKGHLADRAGQVTDKAGQVKDQVTGMAGQVTEQVADKAGHARGQAAAAGVKARATAPEPVRQAADRAVGVIQRRDVQFAVTAATVLLVGWLVLRMRRR